MPKYLLDTHVFLWMSSEPAKIKPETMEILKAPENEIYLSVASTWEMAIKLALGKLQITSKNSNLKTFINRALDELCLKVLPIELDHSLEVLRLKKFHQDPFDHMLIAQALCEGMPILTSDKKLIQYGAEVILN